MQFIHPWMLLGLALIPVAVLLHVFRAPGRRHEVSSLALWRDVLRRTVPESTEKLRRFDWLLLLEILVIALLVLGLAWPVVWTVRPHRVMGVIYDISASMKTVDSGEKTRFQKAERAMKPVDAQAEIGDEDIIYWGPQASGREETSEPADIAVEPERLLVDGLARMGTTPQVIFLITDKPPAKIDDPRVRIIAVGESSKNAGIITFSGECKSDGSCELFVRAANYAGAEQARRLVVTNASKTLASEEVKLSPNGGALDRVFKVRLDKSDPVVRVRLEPVGRDGLSADDEVAGVFKPLSVVVEGKTSSPAYARLFGGPVFEGTAYLEAPEGAGVPLDSLLIAEGFIPQSLGAMTVVVNPPEGEIAGISIGKELPSDPPAQSVTAEADPLTKDANFSDLKLGRYRPLTLGESAHAVLRVGNATVAAVADLAGSKVIVLGFDPAQAGWTLKPSFVVFWANVLAEAKKAAGAGGLVFYRTGDVVKGSDIRTDKVGVREIDRNGRKEFFAVNLLSEIESDNRPSPLVAHPPSFDLPAPLEGKSIPLGPWLCLAAIVLAGAWWYFRR